MPASERPDNGSLPTNIEQATPEHIQQNLASWEKRILSSWISSNITDPDKPLFLVEAERQAKVEGVPLETILDRYSTQLRNSTYPTPECLRPEEVEHVTRLSIPLDPKRLNNHVQKCAPCSMLLAASNPDTISQKLDDLFFRPPEIQSAKSEELEEANFWAFVGKRGRAIFVPTLFLLIACGVSFLIDRRVALLAMRSTLLTCVIVFATSMFYLYALRRLKPNDRYRPWATAALVGLAFSVVFLTGFHQNTKSVKEATDTTVKLKKANDTTVKLAQSLTEMLASSALEQKQATGEFLTSKQASAIVSEPSDEAEIHVKTEPSSSKSITYTVTIPKIPGVIKAEVQSDSDSASGSAQIVLLDDNNKVQSTISYLLGKVKEARRIDANSAEIIFEAGRGSYVLRSQDKPLPHESLPPAGSLVVAKVNHDTSSMNSYRVVSVEKSSDNPKKTTQEDPQKWPLEEPHGQRNPQPPRQ